MLLFLALLGAVALQLLFAIVCMGVGFAMRGPARVRSLSSAGVVIGPFRSPADGGGMKTLELVAAMTDTDTADVAIKLPLIDEDGQEVVNADGSPYLPDRGAIELTTSHEETVQPRMAEVQPEDRIAVEIGSGKVGTGTAGIWIPGPTEGHPGFQVNVNMAVGNSGLGRTGVVIQIRPETPATG